MKKKRQPPAYNPYPPGILPSDLDSEIARVQREIQEIENENIADWQALPSPNVQGTRRSFRAAAIRPLKYLASC